MPHPDNRNWMSLLVGEMPEAPRRVEIADLIASRKMWDLSHLNENLPPEVGHDDVALRTRQGETLSGEIYVPRDVPVLGSFLYLHGGGWCTGESSNERQIAMRFAAVGYVVLNLDYGLAPEHPFPWAVEDCIYGARWLAAHAAGYGSTSAEIVVGGQSAGANLAAAVVVALTAGPGGVDLDGGDLDAAPVTFRGAMLLSGIYSFPLLLAEPGSNVGPAELWHQAYLGPNFLRRNREPLASPMFADLSGFPPCYVACGDEDSLLGQSLGMAKALTGHNVPTTVSVIAGFDHAYQFLEDRFVDVHREMERVRAWLASTGRDDVTATTKGSP